MQTPVGAVRAGCNNQNSMATKIFRNQNVLVEVIECDGARHPSISFHDLKDQNNLPAGYTQNVRGLKRAADFISSLENDERLKDDINFHDIFNVLDRAGLRPRTYCMMD